MGSVVGLQQLLRMQGLEWGDSAGHDYHFWFDGGGLQWDAPVSPSLTLPTAPPNDVQGYTVRIPPLTADYGTSVTQTRGFYFNLETDTSAQNYPGIVNALIARVNVNSAAGSTITKAEGFAGVINIKAGSGGDLGSGSYGTEGGIQHNGTQTITGTVKGVNGGVSVTSSGSFTTAYGGDFSAITTLGQTGTYLNTAGAVNAHVDLDAAVTVGAVTSIGATVTSSTTGTVTGITQAVLGFVLNTGDCTYNGNVYGVRGLTQVSGAAAFGAATAVYGVFANSTFSGTTTGATSANVAMNAEIQWSSTGAPAVPIYAIQARWRVNTTTPFVTVATAEAFHILAPNITASNTITAGRGIRIANQGAAAVTTAEGLRIDGQTGAGTNRAIVTGAGTILLGDEVFFNHIPVAINSSATATAVQMGSGYITSTSAAPTTITLPTATQLGTQFGLVQGSIFRFTVDNTAGANTVTVAVGSGITVSALGAANAASFGLLTVPSGATGQGTFELYFSSATAATLSRVG